MPQIDVDYLIVGAGATAMAFADTLVAESDATVAIVDRYAAPGGHWNVAYPYVRLHQPSLGYGVNSRPLGSDVIDATGWNAGLYELASVGEVLAYFDQVLQQTLLPSGRVTYLPMTEYLGATRCRSLVTGEETEITARRVVDSTFQRVTVPAMRPPAYDVAGGVACITPNALADLASAPEHVTVVGAGKTGIDACLFLLRHGMAPERLSWVMPRDAWLVDRAQMQPGPLFADAITPVMVGTLEAIVAATDMDDLLDRFDACGRLTRIDPTVRPTMYRCATVSRGELEQLRRIEDVIRLGRVRRIEPERLLLDDGEVAARPGTLYVDCTADGLERRPAVPVFDGNRITLQSVRTCQQAFSAAFIAHVEVAYDDEATKNELCQPIPHPSTDRDFIRCVVADVRNAARWADDAALMAWLDASRLDWLKNLGPQLPEEPEARAAVLEQTRAAMEMAAAKLQALLDADGESARTETNREALTVRGG